MTSQWVDVNTLKSVSDLLKAGYKEMPPELFGDLLHDVVKAIPSVKILYSESRQNKYHFYLVLTEHPYPLGRIRLHRKPDFETPNIRLDRIICPPTGDILQDPDFCQEYFSISVQSPFINVERGKLNTKKSSTYTGALKNIRTYCRPLPRNYWFKRHAIDIQLKVKEHVRSLTDPRSRAKDGVLITCREEILEQLQCIGEGATGFVSPKLQNAFNEYCTAHKAVLEAAKDVPKIWYLVYLPKVANGVRQFVWIHKLESSDPAFKAKSNVAQTYSNLIQRDGCDKLARVTPDNVVHDPFPDCESPSQMWEHIQRCVATINTVDEGTYIHGLGCRYSDGMYYIMAEPHKE